MTCCYNRLCWSEGTEKEKRGRSLLRMMIRQEVSLGMRMRRVDMCKVRGEVICRDQGGEVWDAE
jgi:hypothetical protein